MIPIVYDQVNSSFAKDGAFFVTLLEKLQIDYLADLGCGTGRLTIHFANLAMNIDAIDPNAEAISYAQEKHQHDMINWIIGDSSTLKSNHYDAITMTGNVAQVFTTEESWRNVIADAFRALKPGGHFIFDCRNPLVKVWEQWEQDFTPEYAIQEQTGEPLEIWTEYDGFVDDVYTFYDIVKHAHTGETIIKQKLELKFRTYDEMIKTLQQVGFNQLNVYGDWELKQATPQSHSFIFDCIK